MHCICDRPLASTSRSPSGGRWKPRWRPTHRGRPPRARDLFTDARADSVTPRLLKLVFLYPTASMRRRISAPQSPKDVGAEAFLTAVSTSTSTLTIWRPLGGCATSGAKHTTGCADRDRPARRARAGPAFGAFLPSTASSLCDHQPSRGAVGRPSLQRDDPNGSRWRNSPATRNVAAFSSGQVEGREQKNCTADIGGGETAVGAGVLNGTGPQSLAIVRQQGTVASREKPPPSCSTSC